MALLWADFPSGSLGIYGGNAAYLLNGLYAEAAVALVDDPDPAIGASGKVMIPQGAAGSGKRELRWVLPSTQNVFGLAERMWLANLPASNNRTVYPLMIRTATNSTIACVTVDTTGRLRVHAGERDGPVVASTVNPVVTANAWYHLEMKFTQGVAGAAAVEVRVNGTTVINAADLTFANPGTPIAQVAIARQADGTGAGTDAYFKDTAYWDGTGAQNNNFLGSVSVFGLYLDGDQTLGGWTTSFGASGYPLLADRVPMNTLTATGLPGTAANIRMDNTYYRFTAGSVDDGAPAGTSANPWLVALGGSADISLSNLHKAVNASGVAGVDYSTALVIHPTIAAVGLSAIAMAIWSKDGVTTSYICSESDAALSWTSGSMVVGLPNDLSNISAEDLPLPAACEFTLSNLPPDITSVRGLISIARAAKVDGGDGNLQVSLTSDGVNYDLGADRPITTAFTYWPDVSELNPTSGAAWTPTQTNSARIRLNRTV